MCVVVMMSVIYFTCCSTSPYLTYGALSLGKKPLYFIPLSSLSLFFLNKHTQQQIIPTHFGASTVQPPMMMVIFF